MKIDNLATQNNIDRSGTLAETSFTIESTPFAFRILAETIYSRKEQSVIRELSTNAADEHISAGIGNKPFEIHIPTTFEPVFWIRDFGKGMSEEDAVGLYTTFFKSTKRNNNEVTGCLGLGSKSPFSVTDSFTIESYYEGVKTIYTCYKDEDRLPKLAKLESFASDEPSGVKIQFPVVSGHYDWRNEAERVFKFFKVKPTCNIELDFDLGDASLEGSDWKLIRFDNYELSSKSYAVMGNVAYPIDFSALKSDDAKERSLFNAFRYATGFVFYFDLGEIAFDPSRERLEYNKKTKDSLVSLLQKLKVDLSESMSKKISESKDIYYARKAYACAYRDLENSIGKELIDVVLDEKVKFNDEVLFEGSLRSFTVGSKEISAYNFVSKKSKVKKEFIENGSFSYSYKDNSEFIVDDGSRGFSSKVKLYKHYNNDKDIFLVNRENADRLISLIGFSGDESEFFVSNDKLPIVPKKVRSNGASGAKSVIIPAWEVVVNQSSSGSISFDRSESNISVRDDEGYYVVANRGIIQLGGSACLDYDLLISWLKVASGLGFEVPDNFYVVNASKAKSLKLEDRDTFSNLTDVLIKFFGDKVSDNIDSYKSLCENGFTKDKVGSIIIHRAYSDKTGHRLVSDHPLITGGIEKDIALLSNPINDITSRLYFFEDAGDKGQRFNLFRFEKDGSDYSYSDFTLEFRNEGKEYDQFLICSPQNFIQTANFLWSKGLITRVEDFGKKILDGFNILLNSKLNS